MKTVRTESFASLVGAANVMPTNFSVGSGIRFSFNMLMMKNPKSINEADN